MDKPPVTFIGLGSMGQGMAGRLLEAGFPLTVYNRTAAAADALVAKGAKRAASPAEAVAPGGIVVTMLANDAALQAVALGPDGFLDRLGPGGVHLSMSTIDPGLAGSLAAAHEKAGGTYVAAPVFGRPPAAASGQLWIALSGPEAAKARVQPILAVLGQGIVDFGPAPTAAHVVKVGGNFLIASAIEAMSEAFALMEKNGVDAKAFHGLLAGSLFACPIYKNYGTFILDEAYDPAGFKLELGLKDIGLVLSAGGASQTPMPLASLLRDRFLGAVARGRGGLDWTAIGLQAREDAGLTPD